MVPPIQCRRLAGFLLLLLPLLPDSLVRAADPPAGLTEGEKRGGWKLLFDGISTTGWRNYRSDKLSNGWAVKDGILERISTGAGDIVTTDQYRNFELSLEYRISKGGNSGIMFRVTEDDPRPWASGPEVQIQDNVDGRDPQKAGWLYQLYTPVKPEWATKFENQVGFKGIDMDDATRPVGEWNHVYLRVSPRQCEVAINGVSYYYFNMGTEDWNKRVAASKFREFPQFGKAEKGHICLQDHGDPVAFRNIRIRELSEDGTVADPVDGQLNLTGVPAFPKLKWEDFEGADDEGKITTLRLLALTHAGDGSNRNFVVSQSGQIYVFPNQKGTTEAKVFLDIRDRVQDWRKDAEEGLLGLAFHPDYRKNGHFYVCYSSSAEPRTSVISRFSVSKTDPNKADPGSELVVMKIPQPFSNHNGGSIAFGHDGYLYIALGDGGGRNDPLGHGQNLGTLMGSLLRIDVNRTEPGRNYAVPADNPFLDRKGAQPEIYAYGFRNIWRLTVDRSTGDLWAADVGQDFWEEVNIVKKGGNYGWSVREASYPFNNKPSTSTDELIPPVWEYDHQLGKSITGGFVYRGSRLPELQGMYVYADFISGRIWALKYDPAAGKVTANKSIASTGFPVLAFGEDEAGEMFYMLETIDGQGIYRFDPTN
ncbi:MAG: family 16 glycoside hydrolase [Planctomycetia bacterium]